MQVEDYHVGLAWTLIFLVTAIWEFLSIPIGGWLALGCGLFCWVMSGFLLIGTIESYSERNVYG
jgi:hypothetical protein